MNVWQAKYEALVAGIRSQEYIENAEKLVSVALRISSARPVTFGEAFDALLRAVVIQQPPDIEQVRSTDDSS
jgi:hypothetical protein